MQKTWEKYNEMEVNQKRGEMGTYHRQLHQTNLSWELQPMSSK